ncbi:MAG TPA: pitrilysin family protein [Clostridia bacterium]|nr:pitrilysin family protein [Clostridia bacterium]
MKKVIENKLLREKLVHSRHRSGLDVYIMLKPGYSRQFAIYATQYGSNDSQFVPRGRRDSITVPDGIAHFLEHKLFEEEEGNVFAEYSKLGAQPNAFTNFNMTAYHFTSTGNFHECLDVLLGFVGRPYFTDENVEKEKGIIAQEIRMYEDNPYWGVYFNLLRGLYHDFPVRKDIAGTVESIYQIDKETLYECYKTFYHPSNMALIVAGDVDPDRVIRQVDELFADGPTGNGAGEIKRIFPEEAKGVNKNRVEEKLAVARPIFALGFKDEEDVQDGDRLLDKLIANDIILDMLMGTSSDIYDELYEEGLIDSSFSSSYTGERHYGYALMTGQTKDPEKVVAAIFDEIEKRKSQPWEQEHFTRIKKKKMGEYIRLFNSLDSTSIQFVSMLFKDVRLLDYLERLEAITYNEIKKEFNELYSKDSSCLSSIMPSA